MQPIPTVRDLDLRQKIGQVLCFGWQGDTPADARSANAHALELVRDMRVGGIVLLARNLGSPEECRAVLDELQALAGIPLLVSIDQEGGRVNRLGPPFHTFAGNMALGAVAEGGEELSYRQARAQAREALAVGANWNCAPVVDVNNNPANPVIGVRSFGEDPERVARLGAAMVRGYQDGGMLAGAKHFPGHGDTGVDSHLALPVIHGDRARLDAVELVPFRAAIAAGVGSLMTTHIVFPALDPERPATMSPAILSGMLRRDLGFGGLVVTDCLEMQAIAATVGTARGAVEALKAGADVALVCHTLEVQRDTVRAVARAVETGELPMERLDEAVERVLAAKRRCLRPLPPLGKAPWQDRAHDALERQIARAAVTSVRRGAAALLPLDPAKPIWLYSAHPAAPGLERCLAERGATVERVELAPDVEPAAVLGAACLRAGEQRGTAVLATWPAGSSAEDRQRDALEQQVVLAHGGRLVVIEMREPYDAARFPAVADVLCAYGSQPCQLEALAEALLGTLEPPGRLPVTIPGMAA